MNGKISYNRLLKSVFGTDLSELYSYIYSLLRIVVHYQMSDGKEMLQIGLNVLHKFENEFKGRAANLLRAYGIVDGKHSKPSPRTQGTGS